MRGLIKSVETSSVSGQPLLQFFCRQGHFLVDPAVASFVIQDIRSPSIAPATVVATTSLTLAHRVLDGDGLPIVGVYAIPTGSTAAWNLGTHRVVVTYQLVAGGPVSRQSIEFEVLSDVDWATTGWDYCGYVSTRRLYEDGYAVSTDAVQTLHRLVDDYSRQLEGWTARQFHPIYKSLYVAGLGTEVLLLREPIVGLTDVYYTWQTGNAAEDSQKVERETYRVRVDHLDGAVGHDSRILCMLELASSWIGDGWMPPRGGSDYSWADRSRNYRLDGVFGYTDGALDPAGLRTTIGVTPRPLQDVVAVLVNRRLEDLTLSTPLGMMAGGFSQIKTRDQMVKFDTGSALSSTLGDVFSGDPVLDNVIRRYVAPTDAIPVGKRYTLRTSDRW